MIVWIEFSLYGQRDMTLPHGSVWYMVISANVLYCMIDGTTSHAIYLTFIYLTRNKRNICIILPKIVWIFGARQPIDDNQNALVQVFILKKCRLLHASFASKSFIDDFALISCIGESGVLWNNVVH